MCPHHSRYKLETLKRELKAWEIHVERNGLEDRKRFIDWLSRLLDPEDLALIIDCEADRRSLWKTYLHEKYGP